MDESRILSKIYDLLKDENVFNCNNETLIKFKYPADLLNLLNFSLKKNTNSASDEEIERFCHEVVQHSLQTTNINFHNQLFGGVDFYGLAASWITEALNTSQYTFETSPCFTLIEQAVIEQSLVLFNYVDGDGIMCPGGSISNMYGIVAARYAKYPMAKKTGNPPGLVAFTSEDSHYSMAKGIHWLGIGTENLIVVKTNEFGIMMEQDLEEKIVTALKNDKKPFFVNATAGTTVLGAFDDFNKIADICEKYKLWLHVDACLGGSAIFSRKHKALLNGIERSHSMSWNPHKTLGAPMQCSLFLIKQKGLLSECNSAKADYLFQQDKFYDVSFDTGDKGSLGFEMLMDNAFDCASYLTQETKKRSNFRLVFEKYQYTNVCFWYIPKYMMNRNDVESTQWWECIYKITAFIKEKMVKDGKVMCGYTPLLHKNIGNFFRMVVTCHPKATNESMDFVLNEIQRIGEEFEFSNQF
ncbi:unnamed protein product [Diamesa tonsa]